MCRRAAAIQDGGGITMCRQLRGSLGVDGFLCIWICSCDLIVRSLYEKLKGKMMILLNRIQNAEESFKN